MSQLSLKHPYLVIVHLCHDCSQRDKRERTRGMVRSGFWKIVLLFVTFSVKFGISTLIGLHGTLEKWRVSTYYSWKTDYRAVSSDTVQKDMIDTPLIKLLIGSQWKNFRIPHSLYRIYVYTMHPFLAKCSHCNELLWQLHISLVFF